MSQYKICVEYYDDACSYGSVVINDEFVNKFTGNVLYKLECEDSDIIEVSKKIIKNLLSTSINEVKKILPKFSIAIQTKQCWFHIFSDDKMPGCIDIYLDKELNEMYNPPDREDIIEEMF